MNITGETGQGKRAFGEIVYGIRYLVSCATSNVSLNDQMMLFALKICVLSSTPNSLFF